jgi:uncharacterized protein YndB with AHSA1/START domain
VTQFERSAVTRISRQPHPQQNKKGHTMGKGSGNGEGGADNQTGRIMNAAPKPGALNGATFRSHRVLPFQPQKVFEAFARPERLTHWWGPNGFTSTFEIFEFRPGGRWKFVLHGPDGSNHPNEWVFLELHAPSKLVLQHMVPPHFVLTVTLAAQQAGTALTWAQEFEDAALAPASGTSSSRRTNRISIGSSPSS